MSECEVKDEKIVVEILLSLLKCGEISIKILFAQLVIHTKELKLYFMFFSRMEIDSFRIFRLTYFTLSATRLILTDTEANLI